MKWTPHFCAKERSPYDGVQWVQASAEIRGVNSETLFSMAGIEVPKSWSQQAVNILASKYFRLRGASESTRENSLKQVLDRVADTIADRGLSAGYFDSQDDAVCFANELKTLIVNQQMAFNSPVWFNCGLFDKYDSHSSTPLFRYDEGRVVRIENGFQHPQVSACFIQSVSDDLMSMFDLLKNEARIFKFGSGTGSNFSSIRGQLEALSGGGASSGLMTFLEIFDRAAGAIKSGGTTRRAAKMVCLDVDHPEVEDFIWWKAKEEKKAMALMKAGYGRGFESESYRSVSGQNSNNSIRLSDDFMKAVQADAEWVLRGRVDGQPSKKVSAKKLFRQIAEAAWECADPGVQFDSTIQQWHTCANSAAVRASNPCSEFMFLDDTACNLASLNLVKFFDQDQFLLEDFVHAVRTTFLAQEILLDFAGYPTEAIAKRSAKYRPLGLGFANLGALCMRLGYAYGSVEAQSLTAHLTSLMSGLAYETSALIAKQKGSFAGFKENQSSMLKVMKQHQQANDDIGHLKIMSEAGVRSAEAWNKVVAAVESGLIRNAQATVIAPTGTIGLMMDCDTTGIEPDYSLLKYKSLSGGGQMAILNASVEPALQALGYGQSQIQKIKQAFEEGKDFDQVPFLDKKHHEIFYTAQPRASGGDYISWKSHLSMMAAAQPFLSGAISKTVNLPNDISVDEIEQIYRTAYDLKLKSVAIYRDGSKAAQPLSVVPDTPNCTQCGFETVLDGSCFKCENCGHTVSCSI